MVKKGKKLTENTIKYPLFLKWILIGRLHLDWETTNTWWGHYNFLNEVTLVILRIGHVACGNPESYAYAVLPRDSGSRGVWGSSCQSGPYTCLTLTHFPTPELLDHCKNICRREPPNTTLLTNICHCWQMACEILVGLFNLRLLVTVIYYHLLFIY